MPHRDFDAERRKRLAETEATTFTLGGDVFTADQDPHPDILIEIQELWGRAGKEVDENGRMSMETMAAMTRATRDAMVGLIVPGDQQRMNVLLDRKDDGKVGVNAIMETLMWLVETVNARPTRPSSPSSGSPEPAGTESPPDYFSQEHRIPEPSVFGP